MFEARGRYRRRGHGVVSIPPRPAGAGDLFCREGEAATTRRNGNWLTVDSTHLALLSIGVEPTDGQSLLLPRLHELHLRYELFVVLLTRRDQTLSSRKLFYHVIHEGASFEPLRHATCGGAAECLASVSMRHLSLRQSLSKCLNCLKVFTISERQRVPPGHEAACSL